MKNMLLFAFITIFSASLITAQNAEKFGEELTLDSTTPISSLVEKPNEYLDKRVQIEGTVVGVCSMRGCWIEVADENDNKIKVKVEDGVIVFPMEAKGKSAKVEGTLYSVTVEGDKEHKHEGDAHKDGESCTGCESSKDQTVYMLKGHGAVIH